MPEQNQPITSLPIKTASGMAATDYLLGIDSAEGYQMLIQDLGDYIIQHATSSLAGENQTLASVINWMNSKFTSDEYSANGLIIKRFGNIAQIVAMPNVTTSGTSLVATISEDAFRPTERVWCATKVYNGAEYVDCLIEITTNGNMSLKSLTSATVPGFQAKYTQCLGFNYFCNGE